MSKKSSYMTCDIPDPNQDLSLKRLNIYLKEPKSAGNRLVMIPDQSKSQYTSAAKAEAKMSSKIHDLMVQFDAAGESGGKACHFHSPKTKHRH